jgi:hypothetical protein
MTTTKTTFLARPRLTIIGAKSALAHITVGATLICHPDHQPMRCQLLQRPPHRGRWQPQSYPPTRREGINELDMPNRSSYKTEIVFAEARGGGSWTKLRNPR